MHFNPEEKQILIGLKGVGPTVISRLEQVGFFSLAELKGQDPDYLIERISEMLNSTCWRNSPQARSVIHAVINLANQTSSV